MRAVMFFAAALALAHTALADPDPIAVMRKMNETVASWPSFRAEIQRAAVGSFSTRTPAIIATIRASRVDRPKDSGPTAWEFIATGKSTPPGKDELAFGVSFDGAKFRVLKAADRTVKEAGPDAARSLLKDDGDLAVGWLLRWNELAVKPLENPDETGEIRYEGRVEVGGVPCEVIYVDYSGWEGMEEMDAWWFIGAADSLPRRIERHFSEVNGDAFDVLTITKMERTDPNTDPEFALAVPEGFKSEVVAAPELPEGPGRVVKQASLPVGSMAPDWTLEDSAGKPHKLSEYRGKVVVMDFWATWCGPCQMAMPGMQSLHEKLSDRGVNVLGINCWEQADPAAFMAEKKFTYGLLVKGDDVAKAYGVSGIPTFYVVGVDGKIIYNAVGHNPSGEAQLEKVIVEHLKANGK